MMIVPYLKSMMTLFSNGWINNLDFNQHGDGTIISKNIMTCMSIEHWSYQEHSQAACSVLPVPPASYSHLLGQILQEIIRAGIPTYMFWNFVLSTICGTSLCLELWLSRIFFNVLHPPPTCQNKYYRKLYM